MKKGIIYIIIIVILIFVAIYLTQDIVEKENVELTNSNDVIENIENRNEVIIEKEVEENEQEPVSNEEDINEEEVTEEIKITEIEQSKNNEAKAIDLVKEKWGEDEKVYIGIDKNYENGKYRVFVRS